MKTISLIIFVITLISSPFGFGLSNHPYYSPWIIPAIIFLVGYVAYSVNFRNRSHFKFFLFKQYLKIRNYVQKVSINIQHSQGNQELLPIQSKSIRLWKLLLKDPDSTISCSLVNKIRQIEKDNMLLILSPINQMDFQMTIMDVESNRSCLFEITFGNKNSETIIDLFDSENEKRMILGQQEKRNSIQSDLDKLLQQQEQSLKMRKIIRG